VQGALEPGRYRTKGKSLDYTRSVPNVAVVVGMINTTGFNHLPVSKDILLATHSPLNMEDHRVIYRAIKHFEDKPWVVHFSPEDNGISV
jgi:hypothetical protein